MVVPPLSHSGYPLNRLLLNVEDKLLQEILIKPVHNQACVLIKTYIYIRTNMTKWKYIRTYILTPQHAQSSGEKGLGFSKSSKSFPKFPDYFSPNWDFNHYSQIYFGRAFPIISNNRNVRGPLNIKLLFFFIQERYFFKKKFVTILRHFG